LGFQIIEGHLDTLYVGKERFLKLPEKRLVLKYYINTQGNLTLHGWHTKSDLNNDQYEASDELELKNGNASTVSFGSGNFLGGVLLRKKEIKQIQDSIRKYTSMNFVGFVPEADPDFTGHFRYNIILLDIEPNKEAMLKFKIVR